MPIQTSTRRRRTRDVDRALIGAVAALGAVGTIFDDAAPTGLSVADVALRAAVGALVVALTSHGRRWSWIATAVLAAVLADTDASLALAGAAALTAAVAAATERRRVLGAVVGALAVNATFRYGHPDPHGLATLAAACALAPAMVSGTRLAPERTRSAVSLGAIAAGGFALVFTLIAAAAGLNARSEADQGVAAARAGLEALSNGDQSAATGHFDDAVESLGRARNQLGSWWIQPARFVPIVGQHLRATQEATRSGHRLATQAGSVTRLVDLDRIALSDGSIDVELLASYEIPLQRLEGSIRGAIDSLDDVTTPWLAAPIADRLASLGDELADALPSAELAAQAAELGPELLGAEGERRYVVLFTTPAEARGTGGFIGSFAEVVFDEGAVSIPTVGRTDELNAALRASDVELSGPPDYLARYGRFHPERFIQDLTLSPDVPSVGEVLLGLYPTAAGREADGVIVIDPFGLAALLELTGPIDLVSDEVRLDRSNAAAYLVAGQYLQPTEEARLDALDEAAIAVVSALLTGSFPSPRVMTDVLGPIVDENRLSMYVRGPGQDLLAAAGVDGAFPAPDGGDFLAVVHQNSANNKIDPYLRRQVDYVVEHDPDTGSATAQLTLTLENTAPAEGLPLSVIGSNDQGLPLGTNELYLSVYSPHELTGATIDGSPLILETARELGYWVYSTYVTLGPGAQSTIVIDLAGTVEPGDYDLTHWPQPLSRADELTVTVSAPTGWIATSELASSAENEAVEFALPARSTERVRVVFTR